MSSCTHHTDNSPFKRTFVASGYPKKLPGEDECSLASAAVHYLLRNTHFASCVQRQHLSVPSGLRGGVKAWFLLSFEGFCRTPLVMVITAIGRRVNKTNWNVLGFVSCDAFHVAWTGTNNSARLDVKARIGRLIVQSVVAVEMSVVSGLPI